ncbi:MAG: FAD-dependent oxidoreductase [Acidobacteriaceae bacterium]
MSYDLIVIGGGVTGSALASRMASSGARVLIVEREEKFHDRIRGEALQPWGVAEVHKLGIAEPLRSATQEMFHFEQILNGQHAFRRELVPTTMCAQPMWSFYHPKAQDILISYAAACGAEILRPASLKRVIPGYTPKVEIESNRKTNEYTARLVALCNGRNPAARGELGFTVHRDSMSLLLGGVRLTDLSPEVDPTVAYVANDVARGTVAALFPQPNGYARAYFGYHAETCQRLQGDGDFARFRQMFVTAAGAAIPFGNARPAGPLASFECADTWVESPYRDGVALVGDAAASSDPSWGQGLSLGFRAARVLSDELLASSDWHAAGEKYAKRHNEDYGKVHTVTGWFYDVFERQGPEADARRARALPLIAQDPTRAPDTLFSGPEFPLDGSTKARFFGEEAQAVAS